MTPYVAIITTGSGDHAYLFEWGGKDLPTVHEIASAYEVESEAVKHIYPMGRNPAKGKVGNVSVKILLLECGD